MRSGRPSRVVCPLCPSSRRQRAAALAPRPPLEEGGSGDDEDDGKDKVEVHEAALMGNRAGGSAVAMLAAMDAEEAGDVCCFYMPAQWATP